MWVVEKLKVYRHDLAYIAIIECRNNNVTKVRFSQPLIHANFVKVFRQRYNTLIDIPLPYQEANIQTMEELICMSTIL